MNCTRNRPHRILATLSAIDNKLAHSEIDELYAGTLPVIQNVVWFQIAMTYACVIDKLHSLQQLLDNLHHKRASTVLH